MFKEVLIKVLKNSNRTCSEIHKFREATDKIFKKKVNIYDYHY